MVLLFDIDGTLAPSGEQIDEIMLELLKTLTLSYGHDLGLVGGGTFEKIQWQMKDSLHYFKYVFAECGSVVWIDGQEKLNKKMIDHVDRQLINRIVKKALKEISLMEIIHHGNQIDFRNGLIYISPPGMQAPAGGVERTGFMEQDQRYQLRTQLIDNLKAIDVENQLEIVLGGSVGIAVYPKGWDKSQVLEYISDSFIEFYGDRIESDGNDYPLYSHPRVQGYGVKSWTDTYELLNKKYN